MLQVLDAELSHVGAHSTRAPEVVLRLGHALALIGPDVTGRGDAGATRTARDAKATRWLAAATGRCDIAIARRPSGRPRLAPPYPELAVALASTAGFLAVSCSPCHPVGVDIEVFDPSLDAVSFSADHYAPGEARAVASQPSQASAVDLCQRLWVAKEAALKVSGRGVFDGLAAPDLSHALAVVTEDGAAFVCHLPTDEMTVGVAVRRWTAPGGHVLFAALAVAD